MNIDKRFMAKVDKCTSTGCWLWEGGLVSDGYGQLTRRRNGTRRDRLAHRYSFEMHVGPIPHGLCVCHKCDVRNCVNPDHLFLGTPDDNAKDRDLKGRGGAARGEKNGRAKLFDVDVRFIRTFLTLGEKQKDIAEFFGVTQATVSYIKNGKTRRQLSQPTTAL